MVISDTLYDWVKKASVRAMSQHVRYIHQIYPICQWRCLADNPGQQWRARALLSVHVTELLTGTVRAALRMHDFIEQCLRPMRTVSTRVSVWRGLSLNPGHGGMTNVRTGEIQQWKLKSDFGLLDFADQRNLDTIMLPGAMLPEGFTFPAASIWEGTERWCARSFHGFMVEEEPGVANGVVGHAPISELPNKRHSKCGLDVEYSFSFGDFLSKDNRRLTV